MKKCQYCKIVLNNNPNHIYYCAKQQNIIKTKLEIKKDYIDFNYEFLNTYEKLYNEYIINNKSLPDLKKEYLIGYKDVLFLLNYYNIKPRTISESAKLISHEKYKRTCLNKYGVENISQVDEIKKKKSDTCKKHYGVDNIRKSKEFKLWLKSYMFETYGAGSIPNNKNTADSWGWKKLSEIEKQERLNKIHSNYKNNKLETRVQRILNEIGISYTSQFFIGSNSFDIKISGIKFLIEIHGDYWHANPNKYNSEDLIIYPFGPKSAKEIWQKDENKNKVATNQGYNILYLWESELNIKSDDELKVFLFEKIIL